MSFLSLVRSPTLTGLLLAALTIAPPQIRDPLMSRFPSSLVLERILKVLKGLFVLNLLGTANGALNTLALNQWQSGAAFTSEKATREGKGKWKWEEEIAVVTGGSSGIGQEVVVRLARRGVRVAVLDVQAPPTELASLPNVTFFPCDITDPTALTTTAHSIHSLLGAHPSILIANAGIAHNDLVLHQPADSLTRVLSINLTSHWHLLQTFVPPMIAAKKGHVMATASMASFVSMPGAAAYSVSKAGVLALYESLRSELRGGVTTLYDGACPEICVSTVHPAFVATPLIANVEADLRRKRVAGGVMDVGVVADAMAEQIFSGKAGQIVLPSGLGRMASLLRGWPHWLQEVVRRGQGITPEGLEERIMKK